MDIAAHWAEYRIKPYLKFEESLTPEVKKYNFEEFREDVERILSSDSILITKKNKKNIEKTTDFKKSVGSYRFENDELYIHLKVGQGSDIPALRADDLMKLVNENQIFDITRIKFLDEKLNEMG